jgi:hypothetical protein
MNEIPPPPGSGDIARILATPAGQEAVEHLVSKLGKMADDANRVAERQEAVAQDTPNYTRRVGHEQSAEFNRALAAVIRHSAGILQNNLPGALPGFPGPPGTVWNDVDGDRWVMCEDGYFRLFGRNGIVKPDEVAKLYGPMTPVGGA